MKTHNYYRLKRQTAIVTGANSGIGRSIAIYLAREGANVVINYHSREEDTREVIEEIKGFGGEAMGFKADVSREAEVDAMFQKTLETYGTVHILVNNAGIQMDASIDQMSLEQWQKVIDVNLTGTFLCSRRAIREFKKRGVDEQVSVSAGKIICISSVHEIIPWAGRANYAASKGGMMLLMKSMAQETAPHMIRINSIGPGAIKTSINKEYWSDPDEAKKMLELIPYNRLGEPEDIARAAVWLASDESEYVTGTTLFVDGGMTLYPGFAEGG
jgi:glucose 1-dehydrogenase